MDFFPFVFLCQNSAFFHLNKNFRKIDDLKYSWSILKVHPNTIRVQFSNTAKIGWWVLATSISTIYFFHLFSSNNSAFFFSSTPISTATPSFFPKCRPSRWGGCPSQRERTQEQLVLFDMFCFASWVHFHSISHSFVSPLLCLCFVNQYKRSVQRHIYPKSTNPQQLQRRFQPLLAEYPDALTFLAGTDEEIDIHCRIASELVGTVLQDGGYGSQARWLSVRDVDRLLFRDFARHILTLVRNTNMSFLLGIDEGRMHHIVYACVIRFLETHRRKMRMRLLGFDGMCAECDRLRERGRKKSWNKCICIVQSTQCNQSSEPWNHSWVWFVTRCDEIHKRKVNWNGSENHE